MVKYYKYNLELKKKLLAKFRNSQKKYKIIKTIAYILYGMAFLIVVGGLIGGVLLIDVAATDNSMPMPLIGFFLGCGMGVVPLAIGNSVMTKAKDEYGFPYCRMEREFLYTDDTGVQYGYHDITNKYTASMEVYQILWENLNRVSFDADFCMVTITGIGDLISYDDYSTKRINYRRSERRFYNDSNFSFILAFDDGEEFLKLLKSKQQWED